MTSLMKRVTVGSAGAFLTIGMVSATTFGTAHAQGGHQGTDNQKGRHGHNPDHNRVQAYFKLNEALHMHASLGFNSLKATAFASPDAEAAKAVLQNNSAIIAAQVEAMYPGTHDQFLDLWNKHIGYYNDYLLAVQQGDLTKKDAAVANLATNATDTGALLRSVKDNKNFSTDSSSDKKDKNKTSFEAQLVAHQTGTLASIDLLVAGDYPNAYAAAQKSYEHMDDLARSMAGFSHSKHWKM